MKKTTIITAIYQTLKEQLNIPQIEAFSENARLNEDLYLDSVLLLQLLLNLEIELGIDVPDSALNNDDFETVSSLADFMLSQYNQTSGAPITNIDSKKESEEAVDTAEEFEDIKVHCFVSCVCEIIKADPRVDHRPFYFGVWDAEVVIDDNSCLAYHSSTLNHDFFKAWYQKLYGVPIHSWYQHDASKAENIKALIKLLNNKTDNQQVMVMLDMFRLPERENKFNQNPFPHYVLLENSEDPSALYMSDPDFRWEGTQDKLQVLHAIESPAVAGGYYFNSQDIVPAELHTIYDYFIACFNAENNPMTTSVKKIIDIHTLPFLQTPSRQPSYKENQTPEHLGDALAQLPVLAIRKYAYEHGLAYFWRELSLSDDEFESWCDVIEELVSGYKQIQYRAMKIANFYKIESSLNQSLLTEVNTLLELQNEREFSIKSRLYEVFLEWCQKHNFGTPTKNDYLMESMI